MTDLFPQALAFTLRWEGTAFVNDPDDHGGATYRGVTQRVYDAFLRGLHRAVRGVNLMTDAELHAIYRARYWNAARCYEIPSPALAVAHFDYAVNSGVGRAVKTLQSLVGVTADGDYGPKTRAAVNAACAHNPALHVAYIDRREAFLRSIAVGRQRKWLAGWLNRVRDLRAYVAKVAP